MISMNKEPVEPDQWPAGISEQMAAVHRIYPVVDTTADPRLVELLKLAEELRRLWEIPRKLGRLLDLADAHWRLSDEDEPWSCCAPLLP
jgi:hypothetical protein